MNWQKIESSPLRHTYPYASNEIELTYGNPDAMQSDLKQIYAENPDCRRVVVAVPENDTEAIGNCEQAGLRFVVNVELRDGSDVALLVHEPEWVAEEPSTIKEMDLS